MKFLFIISDALQFYWMYAEVNNWDHASNPTL